MRRSIIVLLLVLLPVAFLAACAQPSAQPTDTTSESAGTVTTQSASNETDRGSDPATVPATDPATDSSEKNTVTADTPEEVLSACRHLVGLTDQGNCRVAVYDLSVPDWTNDPSAIVWEFRHEKYCRGIAGLKLRHNEKLGGDVVLFCGPEGGTIVSYETKEVLYHTIETPDNPHSVELLPDGTFLVSGTNGKVVYAYNPFSGKEKRTATLTVPDGHGVLWDPEYDMLWVAGLNNIDSYAVEGGPEKPVFTKIYTYGDLPGWIHDLAPVYGDTSRLWFTNDKGVQQLDKETGKWSHVYNGASFTGSTGATGVGSFPDGVLVWSRATGKTDTWTTDDLHAFVPLSGGKGRMVSYKAQADAWYKCRVWISDYQ